MAWPPTTHQDVEDDLTNGHGWATSLSGRFGLGEHAFPTAFPWIAGRYYSSSTIANTTGAGGLTASLLYLTPIYFPTSKAVDQIAINVTSAGTAGHVARLGIYNSDASTGLPTTVRVDAGTVAADSLGTKTLTISTSLAGLFWVAVTGQSGGYTALQPNGAAPIGGYSSLTATASYALNRASTVPTSALPNLTGDATVVPTTAATLPRVFIRAA